MLSAGFVTCSDNDDDDNDKAIGTWFGNDDDNNNITFIFKSNGTGTWTMRTHSSTEIFNGTFSYEMGGHSKGTIVLKYDYSYNNSSASIEKKFVEVFYFVIEGKSMYFYDDDYGDNLEMVLTKQ